ncbi:manganese ABC transporter ATP-binding protein [Paractinoplanes deccanensis]|uniref:Manganese ABC transporter ATP-binding protein n=1 Tax=Paractinoplanes deccanensis TaxID=113561 RepID=A0ABQ3Y5S1_9ACTN|nr:metal ABC transporter ATP-binding protein [Actinoplanes deccanensis]GID75342.1 manganese ABC transporter ATP-binding protein [Actinoplanes deccanensis]
MVLRFTDASVGYRGAPVLTQVNLELPAGRCLALAGPNGAGKSTLIKAVLGLSEVLGGTAEVFGRSPARARDLCGYVPQVGDLDPDFPVTAAQVVLMGRYRRIGWWRPTRSADRRAAKQALDRVGLADAAGRRFGLLSGGQRQRVLLARALAAEPRLLLLDEPFNGVDVVSQEAILAVLRELTSAGTALLLSTHDLALARDVADLVCLVNGRQWAFGPPGEVLTASGLRDAYGGRTIDLADGRTVLVEP